MRRGSAGWLMLVVVGALACTSTRTGNGNGDAAEGGEAAAGGSGDGGSPTDAPAGVDAPAADAGADAAEGDARSTLVVSAVCGGEPGQCPAHPAAGAACPRVGLCCVYQERPPALVGCTCHQDRWVCAGQLCGCVGGGGNDAAGDRSDDVHPQCAGLARLVLADPHIVSGKLTAGQGATVGLTIRNTGTETYAMYPGAVMETSTPGLTFVDAIGGVALEGVALLAAGDGRPLMWAVRVEVGVAAGTVALFSARVVGGGARNCSDAFTLSFAFDVE